MKKISLVEWKKRVHCRSKKKYKRIAELSIYEVYYGKHGLKADWRKKKDCKKTKTSEWNGLINRQRK